MFKFKTNNNDTIVISQRPVHTTRTYGSCEPVLRQTCCE